VKTVLRKHGNDQFCDMRYVVEMSRWIQWSKNEFSHGLSPEPTAVGAGRSAVAINAANRRWFSFLRSVLHENMKTIIKQFAVVAGIALLLTGCSIMPPAKGWEYKTITTENQDGEKQLNSLGKDGWVLVGFTYTPRSQTDLNDEYHYVFKRPRK
jgi:hypothetical protein